MKWTLTFAVLTAAASTAAAALATPPGSNGPIAFTRYTDSFRTTGAIFAIQPDGQGERRVTRPPRGSVDFQPDWSRDGSKMVFQREYQDKPYETITVNRDGSGIRRVDPGCPPGIPSTQICEENQPAWAPDGRRIAFARAYGRLKQIRGEEWIEVSAIAIMDADGGNVRQLTQPRRPTSSEDSAPVWAPNGRRIAFVRLNSTARPQDRRAIFAVNTDGSRLRRLTPWSLDAGDHPDWSPDGRRILFRAPANEEFIGSNLWTVRSDGTGLRKVTRFGPGAGPLSASFSPDGKSIVFGLLREGRLPDIYTMRVDGSDLHRVTRSPSWESAPDWGGAARP